jgi:hypothetical protein
MRAGLGTFRVPRCGLGRPNARVRLPPRAATQTWLGTTGRAGYFFFGVVTLAMLLGDELPVLLLEMTS